MTGADETEFPSSYQPGKLDSEAAITTPTKSGERFFVLHGFIVSVSTAIYIDWSKCLI